jgi:predicted RNA-binding protein with EMAP domain
VTLVGEADRKMLKAAIKHGSDADQIRHRIVPPEAVSKWAEKLEELKDEISEILKEEKEEKQVYYYFIFRQCNNAHLYLVSSSRNGVEEGAEHDRTRGRNLLEACADLVPDQ